MKNRILYALLVAAAITGGCAIVPANGPYDYGEPVVVAPPPPRVEYVGYPPVVGQVWIGGFWSWTGRHHEWVPGHWRRHGVDTTGFRTAGSVMVTAGARMMVDGNKAHAADHATIVVATGVNSPPASAQERTNMDQ